MIDIPRFRVEWSAWQRHIIFDIDPLIPELLHTEAKKELKAFVGFPVSERTALEMMGAVQARFQYEASQGRLYRTWDKGWVWEVPGPRPSDADIKAWDQFWADIGREIR